MAPIVAAFGDDPRVTYGGKGFGSAGLKLDGRIFAMISSRGKFVVKLPKARVDELVGLGKGERFDPGHGRVMKEWLVFAGAPSSWLDVAEEAHQFARGGKRRAPPA